ncbi:MAG: HIT family protein [Candidatus Pacearchaeota archaeon]
MMSDEEAKQIKNKLLEQIDKLPEEQAEILRKQVETASNEQLEQFLRAQQSQSGESECIFCQIIEGKLETIKIYEDSDIIVVLDVYPAAVGQMIVMPKQHFSTIGELPDALLNKLFVFVKAVSQVFLKVTGAEAFNIFVAQGDAAGQRVKHFCVNVIPRYENDKISFELPRIKIDKKELEKLGEKLRKEAEQEIRSKLEAENEKAAKRKREADESETEKMMRHIKIRMP